MGVIDNLKTIGSTLQKANKIEEYAQILEVQQQLLDMQKQIQDLESANRKLKEQIEIRDSLSIDRGAYWRLVGEEKAGPYCTRCYDVDGKLVRLTVTDRGRYWATCPNCKSMAEDPAIKDEFPENTTDSDSGFGI